MIKTCPPYNQATHRPVPDAFDEMPDGAGGVQLVQRIEPIPPEEIAAERAAERRADRDSAMPEALNVLSRHRNQKDYGLPTTLTDEQAAAWSVYLQGLRDFPETGIWPDKPE